LLRLLTVQAATRGDLRQGTEVDELSRALQRMPPRVRIPWILHRVMGETLPAVADIEGVSLATIKRRIAAAEAQIPKEAPP
jgi:DNA-directed RNA polymerase specialized sigma24 family protein